MLTRTRTVLATDASTAVNVRRFGAVGDGLADDTAALQRALDSGRSLHLPEGVYRTTATLNSASDTSITGDGPGSVIDASAVDGNAIAITGQLTALPDLSETPSGNALTFDTTPTLARGDIICIWDPAEGSYSTFRPVYYDGEFAVVNAVDGATVALTSRVHKAYDPTEVNLYRLGAVVVTLTGFGVKGTVQVTRGRNVQIARMAVQTTGHRAIGLTQCVGVSVRDCDVSNDGIDEGTDYGISIANCQHVRVSACDVFGRRHSVVTGGAGGPGSVPCRDVVIDGCTLKNSGDIHNADFHGNTIASLYTNCTIYGGAGLQGRDNAYVNNVIYGMRSAGTCLYGAEMVGGTHRFVGNRLFTHVDPNESARGVVDFGGNSVTAITEKSGDLTIVVRDNTCESVHLSGDTNFLLVLNRGSTSKLNVICENNVLLVNALANVARVRLIWGTASKDFVTASGNLANVSATELNADVGYA